MEAKELRIGNCIELDGVLCIVKEIHSGGAIVDIPETGEEIWIDLFQFSPVSLTEEWLLKLGFLTESYIATGDFMIRGSKIINIKSNRGNFDYNIIISADDYDNWRFIVETNPYSKEYKNVIDLTLKPLKFIHELQNTFHALTSEELTLN